MEQKLLNEIKNLPEEIAREVSDFIEFLKDKKRKEVWRKEYQGLLKQLRTEGRSKGITYDSVRETVQQIRDEKLKWKK